ncbi:MAG: glutamine-hydrolyzing GMP synthase [Planctomycetota bacterium]
MVAIVDFGSQYTQLIARRVRELGMYSEILMPDVPAEVLAGRRPRAIILSGGPASVHQDGSPRCDPAIFELGVPVLGICYGMQLMARTLGGVVLGSDRREYGRAFIDVKKRCGLFNGLGDRLAVWMSHGDRVEELPPGFEVLAVSASSPVAAMADPRRQLYGLQFHPEVVHTPTGTEMLRNVLFRIAGCRGDWSMAAFVETEIARLREQVGDDRVLCAMSGGVDSSVLACLLDRAIGDRLQCVFVNNGLLRRNEAREVVRTFKKSLGLNLKSVNASDEFLKRLRGVRGPERKRRIIGETFIRVFERAVRGLGEFKYLAQGTLYPDVVESRSAFGGPSAVIKTHHNVGGMPARIGFELIEPFRHLFKDEVRRVGEELGLPESVIWRHPFPGPGLAVRVIGPVTRRKLQLLRHADAIFIDELRRAGLYREVWQAFAVLLSGKAVGVMGDERTYASVVALRAVTSRDGMTADWARLPHDVLARAANRIINEVQGVNRVVYDVSSKPPGTIEWE